ncbi:MAG: hypothetical protein IT460_17150 [Planctomycetes bacterium]|nr:hypothetical protein [Planctomycetota bacterium]
MRRLAALAVALLALAFAGCGKSGGDDDDEFSPTAVAAAAKAAGTVNGLCPIMKKPVVAEEFVVWKGMKIGFCCPPCKPKFEKDPARYIAMMEADPVRYGWKR